MMPGQDETPPEEKAPPTPEERLTALESGMADMRREFSKMMLSVEEAKKQFTRDGSHLATLQQSMLKHMRKLEAFEAIVQSFESVANSHRAWLEKQPGTVMGAAPSS
jgi:signal recognition particle GTPase